LSASLGLCIHCACGGALGTREGTLA